MTALGYIMQFMPVIRCSTTSTSISVSVVCLQYLTQSCCCSDCLYLWCMESVNSCMWGL